MIHTAVLQQDDADDIRLSPHRIRFLENGKPTFKHDESEKSED